MKKSFFYLLLMTSLVLTSCQKESNQNETEYYPLKVGNSWTYEVYNVEDSGEENLVRTDMVEVIGTTTINGIAYFVIERSSSNPSAQWNFIQYLREEDGYYYNENNEAWMYFGGAVGEVVYSNSLDLEIGEGDVVYNYSIAGLNETVTTPVGSFDCLLYQNEITSTVPNWDWSSKFDNYYFADGVGLVKYWNSWASSNAKMEFRLTEYNIVE